LWVLQSYLGGHELKAIFALARLGCFRIIGSPMQFAVGGVRLGARQRLISTASHWIIRSAQLILGTAPPAAETVVFVIGVAFGFRV
jgi:hypothetical protein